MKVGDRAEISRAFNAMAVEKYAEITGDNNPIHLDEAAAERSIFKRRVVHGMLVSGLFSAIFGTILPGKGCIYLSQELKFIKPVFIDDIVIAQVYVVAIDDARSRVTFETQAFVNNQIVVTGKAQLLIQKGNK